MHQNFPDFTFVTGKIIGKKLTLKGEIDSLVAMDLIEKASLAFLQKHLGKRWPSSVTQVAWFSGQNNFIFLVLVLL